MRGIGANKGLKLRAQRALRIIRKPRPRLEGLWCDGLYPKYSGQYPVRKGGDTAALVMELCNIVQGDTKAASVIVLYGIDIAYLLKVVKILNYSQV